VTGDALAYAVAALKLPATSGQLQSLMDAYRALSPFPENRRVLEALHRSGIVLGTLSNGTIAMLEAALASSGLRGLLSHVLSVDAICRYKTHPDAYALGPAALGLPAAQIAFVSSNCWDVAGATWYGYRTFWVNRSGAPLDRLDAQPEGSGRTLEDLVPFVA